MTPYGVLSNLYGGHIVVEESGGLREEAPL